MCAMICRHRGPHDAGQIRLKLTSSFFSSIIASILRLVYFTKVDWADPTCE